MIHFKRKVGFLRLGIESGTVRQKQD